MSRVNEWGPFHRGDEVTLDGGTRRFGVLGAELDEHGVLRHLLIADPRNGAVRPVRVSRVTKVVGDLVAGEPVATHRISEKGTPSVYRSVRAYRGQPVVIAQQPAEPPARRWQLTMEGHDATFHPTKKACIDEVRARLDQEAQAA